jgi:hypothetical protein
MPGFIGGSSAGSGTGGEISFPKEFIDPVTKLRVSQPETLIDTDFEYGLQPTKWETVELINNTPSFFSKGGDTTIPNISALVTNAGTREITVTTAIEHGLSVGIPISVTGTKSVTADGTYIINSIPNTFSFTYLCKENQPTTASIEDLYTSIITGEFFQGSQIRIASAAGMVTNASATSTITVTTPSAHGFKVNTPFYFLNLNSTVSQVFDSSNSTTKSFDASNSATAQTFDGSNTLSSTNIDFSNSATVGGTTSAISGVSAAADTISVTHTTEGFAGKPIGTPLYYNVTTSSNYFADNPRGIVFLKTNNTLGSLSSTFQVSALPDGDAIDITASMTGTFQLANQARTFAGNNVDLITEQTLNIVNDAPKTFNGANAGGLFGTCTSFPGNSTVNLTSGSGLADLAWYEGAMVFYTTTGTAPSGLTNNTTYFVTNFFQQGTSIIYSFSLKTLPNAAAITTISGGTGTHTFTQIGVSIDRDVFHVKDNGYVVNDMLRYNYPAGGKFAVVSIDQDKDFYFVSSIFDAHNFTLNQVIGELVPATDSRTGGTAGSAITPTSVTAVGFGAGLTFAVTSGTLPAGLSLNASTGAVSGTPSGAYATASVTITATDSAGTTGTQVITFQFNAPPALYAFTSATWTTGGVSGRYGPGIGSVRSGLGSPSWANTYLTMPEVNGVSQWVVPQTGSYTITARGASGGNGGQVGGDGAVIVATVTLTESERLNFIVGQRGNNYGGGQDGGGGGASIVSRGSTWTSSTILVGAGGGGGGASNGQTGGGRHGQAGQTGGGAYGGSGGNGAPNGSGSENGSGGGGWFSQGSGNDFGRHIRSSNPTGAGSVYGDGSNAGGFAGGAGGWGSGGGGGGYSGGSPVINAGQNRSGSGGGGSFVGNGASQVSATAGAHNGNGSITVVRN